MSRKIPQVNRRSPSDARNWRIRGDSCAYRISSAVGIAGIAPDRLVVQLVGGAVLRSPACPEAAESSGYQEHERPHLAQKRAEERVARAVCIRDDARNAIDDTRFAPETVEERPSRRVSPVPSGIPASASAAEPSRKLSVPVSSAISSSDTFKMSTSGRGRANCLTASARLPQSAGR